MDLRNVSFDKAIDASVLDNKLNGLKWISCLNPNDPKKEIANLRDSIKIIKSDNRKKGIVGVIFI